MKPLPNELLATKRHKTKTGARFHKAFFWRHEWYWLTGVFGKLGKETVAQACSMSHVFAWVDETGNFVQEGSPIRGLWQEIVPDVTNRLWGE